MPTRNAHINCFDIKICNVLSKKASQPSFYNVFSLINKNTNLIPGLDVRSLKMRLKRHNKTLSTIAEYRNKKVAHWDMVIRVQRKPILFGDCKRMLGDLQDVFNEISGAAYKNVWSFKPIQHGDVNALLNHLTELRPIHKQQTDISTEH